MSYKLQKNFIQVKISQLSAFLSISESDAFLRLSAALLLDLDENNIDDDLIIDNSGDKQLDVIFLEEEGNKKRLFLIQAKKTDGFSSNTIIQIANGLHWIFEVDGKRVGALQNVKFKDKINDIRKLWDSNLEVHLYYCTLGDEAHIAKEAVEQIRILEKKYKQFFNDKFHFNLIGPARMHSLLRERDGIGKVAEEDIKYEYSADKGNLIDQHLKDFKGLVCTIRGSEIARLVFTHGDKLFDRNIRKFLGENKVNRSILKTCIDKQEGQHFWFFNNGITIVCDDFHVVRNPQTPTINIKNLQIVNGCQTATTLSNADRVGQLNKNVKIMVKIFATKDSRFVERITEATNNQNSINLRDLRANDDLQILIEGILKQKYGLYFERKKNQFANLKNLRKKQVINNEKLAQAFLAIGRNHPSAAKSSKNKLFGEDYYEKIFNNPVEQLLFCYKVSEFCEQMKKRDEQDQIKYALRIYGNLHIACLISYHLLKSRSFPNAAETENLIKLITDNKKVLQKHYENAFARLYKKVKLKFKKKEIDNLNNYFKTVDSDNLVNQLLQE